MSAHAAPAEAPLPGARRRSLSLPAATPGVLGGLGVAAGLVAVAVIARGGTSLGPNTGVEIALTLGSAVLVALALLAATAPAPSAAWAVAALLGLGLASGVSTVWSLSPSDSWEQAGRTLAYAALFAAAVAAARLARSHWRALLGGLVAGGAALCAYALATKVFPSALGGDDVYARLREPYGYWNSVGLTAALTIVGALWLAARREGRALVNALAYPITGLAMVVLMLSYSRGSLVAAVAGTAVWLVTVPRRLRSAALLLTGAAVAAPVVAWTFAQPALTQDRLDASLRAGSGHDLGLLALVAVALLYAAGLVVGFVADRRPLTLRRRDHIGLALVVALALVPVGVVGGLTVSQRGLGGSVSHAVHQLTDPHAKTPPNQPSRLTGVASVRARYWNEALNVFRDHPIAGSGAAAFAVARQRYRAGTLDVRHAHGYVVQTLADLGLLGLAVSLLMVGAWLWAALAASRPLGYSPRAPGWLETLTRRGSPAPPPVPPPPVAPAAGAPMGAEQAGLLCLLAVVVAFAVHSTIDWTWDVPGNAIVALVCAGWLAGCAPRRRLAAEEPTVAVAGAAPTRSPWAHLRAVAALAAPERRVAAVAVVLLALVVAWSEDQPLRSAHADDQALAAFQRHDVAGARARVGHAAGIDPVSVDPLFDLAAIDSGAGDVAGARVALQRAVHRQPSNAQTWLRLADLELNQAGDARAALADLRPALYLDPHNPDVIEEFLVATRQIAAAVAPTTPAARAAAPATAPHTTPSG